MDVQRINRLNNEYSALICDAVDIRYSNNDIPSAREGLCYQKAAQICSELARLTVGNEERHWVENKANCERRMREIMKYLDPQRFQDPKAAANTSSNGTKTPDKSTPKSAGDSDTKKPAKDSTISEETVARWFQHDLNHGLNEVVGMEETKALLQSCVNDAGMAKLDEFLDMPTVRSFFFYGPPGCGKTFTIEAFAYELIQKGYKYMSLKSADIHSKFSGEADKIVERAFAEAAANAPCILFIDEIDGVCQSRSMPHLSDFNMQLTTTFLTAFNKLSKLNKERKSIIFIGATNYPANVDVAMLDRVEMVQIPLPDEELRKFTFANKFKKISMEPGFGWDEVAEQTEGYNQRDINRVTERMKTLLRKAVADQFQDDETSVEALRDGKFGLTRAMFQQAMSEYQPSPKNDIEKQLSEFEDQVRSM